MLKSNQFFLRFKWHLLYFLCSVLFCCCILLRNVWLLYALTTDIFNILHIFKILPPLLESKEPQFSQTLFVWHILQVFNHLCMNFTQICVTLGISEQDEFSRCVSPGWRERRNPFPVSVTDSAHILYISRQSKIALPNLSL